MSGVPEMVERVARAMWQAREETLPEDARVPFDNMGAGEIHIMARAALTAMREPSEAMTKAGVDFALGVSLSGDYRRSDYICDMHRRQIDTALTAPASASERGS